MRGKKISRFERKQGAAPILSDTEVDELVEEFNRLNAGISRIGDILRRKGVIEDNGVIPTVLEPCRKGKDFRVGDSVEVTNSYGVGKGVEGTITKLTPQQAYVQPIDGGKVFRKYKQNLTRIIRKGEY